MTFKEWQACISDFAGLFFGTWTMVLLTVNPPNWVYVMIIIACLSTIVGKRVMDNIGPMGIGGGTENGTNGAKNGNSVPDSAPHS